MPFFQNPNSLKNDPHWNEGQLSDKHVISKKQTAIAQADCHENNSTYVQYLTSLKYLSKTQSQASPVHKQVVLILEPNQTATVSYINHLFITVTITTQVT